jgi:nitrogen-specific signal transduction histidine kinase
MSDERRRLAHDLRNKVNSLRLSSSALHLAEDRDETLEWLDAIILAAERATDLLDRLDQTPDEASAEQHSDY